MKIRALKPAYKNTVTVFVLTTKAGGNFTVTNYFQEFLRGAFKNSLEHAYKFVSYQMILLFDFNRCNIHDYVFRKMPHTSLWYNYIHTRSEDQDDYNEQFVSISFSSLSQSVMLIPCYNSRFLKQKFTTSYGLEIMEQYGPVVEPSSLINHRGKKLVGTKSRM